MRKEWKADGSREWKEAGRADKVGKEERGRGRLDRKEGLKKYGEGREYRLGGGC